MGLTVDTSIIIAAERAGFSVQQMLREVVDEWGETDPGISVVTVTEFIHGIERAKTEQQRQRRQTFFDDLVRAVQIHPVSLEIARRAGRLSGQEAARGFILPFADLLIGTTALQLGFDVLTENVRDFEKIPGLTVRSRRRD